MITSTGFYQVLRRHAKAPVVVKIRLPQNWAFEWIANVGVKSTSVKGWRAKDKLRYCRRPRLWMKSGIWWNRRFGRCESLENQCRLRKLSKFPQNLACGNSSRLDKKSLHWRRKVKEPFHDRSLAVPWREPSTRNSPERVFWVRYKGLSYNSKFHCWKGICDCHQS